MTDGKNSLDKLPISILESISDGVFTVDEHWIVTSFNRAAEEITGTSREDAIGQLCSEVFKSGMCESHCALRQSMETGQPVIARTGYIIDAKGNKIPVSVSAAILRDEEGKIIGGAETFRDLSELEALRKEVRGRYTVGDIVSNSSLMKSILELVPPVAASRTTTLIQGETGTGKELLARAIHNCGPGSMEPFIAVNCGALPESLLESELFGYKKGAFTGAASDKPGRFTVAGKGTIFLDEIGEIPPSVQVKLLRVLQERTFEPLGSSSTVHTQARIIAATNKNLASLVKSGEFREDLYYRINIISLELPPLRDRKEDIPLLANEFIDRFNSIQKRFVKGLSTNAYALLMAYEWPGNVRELQNVIERAFILSGNGFIEPDHLPENLKGQRQVSVLEPMYNAVQRAEREMIIAALESVDYSRVKAARALGIHKTTLFRKMKKFRIPFT